MSNPLTDIMPPKARQIAYAVLFTIGLLLTGAVAGFLAVTGTIPAPLAFVLAFYTAISGGGYALPSANVNR